MTTHSKIDNQKDELKQSLFDIINMTTVVQDINAIHSLRRDLRDLKLPLSTLNSIESIHTCLRGGTDLSGWKKVDWRNNGGANSNSYSGRSNQNNKSAFFINRQTHNNLSNTSNHQAFSSRNKNTTSLNTQKIQQDAMSIPLTTTNTEHNTSQVSDVRAHPPHKYVSRFKKNSEKVEDTILNTIILGKLNKFSEPNYDEIKEFITHIIDSGQTDMIKCFMKLVFEKAASEEMFCPLYAKLLSQLSARYPVLLTEMTNLYSQYMEIFEEIAETSAENYNEVCKRNIEKKYRRGYSQFLAELIKHNVINQDIFMRTVNKIIYQVEYNCKNKDAIKLNEEFADCLMKIMKAIQNDVDGSEYDTNPVSKINEIRSLLKDNVLEKIKPLTARNSENLGMTNKSRFTLLDIYEGIQRL